MTSALNGVVVFAPDATMIGQIALPERCANLCFGGRKRNRLFMAASQSVYAVYVNTEGAARRLNAGANCGVRHAPLAMENRWCGELPPRLPEK